MMHVHWRVSFRASCLHAAQATALGQVALDTRLAEAIAGPVHALRQTIQAAGWPRVLFWRNLVGLSVVVDSVRDLAERVVIKTVGGTRSAHATSRLVASIAALEAAMRQAAPNLLDELQVRVEPLRQAWEARGPELLHHMARWTDPRVVADEATVVLVHPFLGGGGSAHIPFNTIHLEAVLTNPVPALPEVLRQAWLLAQLNLDLPVWSEHIDGQRLADVAELAMLPVTLQAADDAGLLRLRCQTIDAALGAWNIVTPPDTDPGEVLWRWWGTYLEARPRWDVAFTALDRMLGGPPAS